MKILAIETSCDETAAAIVEDGWKILANIISSQVDLHSKTGGVVPEVAAREHVLKMPAVLDECLKAADCIWDDIEAIAVTKGPGLISSLIIGTETASVISYVLNKPLIPVQHIAGHVYSNWLEVQEEIKFPVVILTVSGGHNELILMRDHHDFEVLGETLDDAAGEAFDKVARLLGLGYPGGPAIAKIAENGDPSAFKLPRIMLKKDSFDFSFSGLKTAVLNEVKRFELRHVRAEVSETQKLKKFKENLAASFQEAVVEVLAEKLIRATKSILSRFKGASKVKEIHLAGGVSANKRLRQVVEEKLKANKLLLSPKARKAGIVYRYPKSINYCTDNAAMIAAAAYFAYKLRPQKFRKKTNLIPVASFEI